MGALTTQARALNNAAIARSIDPNDPTDMPAPPAPVDFRAMVTAALAPGTDPDLPLPTLLRAVADHLEGLRTSAEHVHRSHGGLVTEQGDLAATVHKRTETLRKRSADLSRQVQEMSVTLDALRAEVAELRDTRVNA